MNGHAVCSFDHPEKFSMRPGIGRCGVRRRGFERPVRDEIQVTEGGFERLKKGVEEIPLEVFRLLILYQDTLQDDGLVS